MKLIGKIPLYAENAIKDLQNANIAQEDINSIEMELVKMRKLTLECVCRVYFTKYEDFTDQILESTLSQIEESRSLVNVILHKFQTHNVKLENIEKVKEGIELMITILNQLKQMGEGE